MMTRTLRDPRVLPLVLSTVVVTAVVVVVLAVLVGLPWWLGLLVGVLAGGAAALVVARRGRSVALRALPPGRPERVATARLDNLIDGLCVGHGIEVPSVVAVDTPSLNAAAVDGPGGPTLVVTRGLVEALDRIQLEAVLAHELALLRDGEAAVGTALAGFASVAPFGLADRIIARMGDDLRIVRADIAGVRLTRYPPGLVSALGRLASSDTTVPGATKASAHLWLAPPTGAAASEQSPSTHPAIETRIDVLREL